MSQQRFIVRHAQTGKEVRGYVLWEACFIGGQLTVNRTDKDGVFRSSTIVGIQRDPVSGRPATVETRNSVYHIGPVCGVRPATPVST